MSGRNGDHATGHDHLDGSAADHPGERGSRVDQPDRPRWRVHGGAGLQSTNGFTAAPVSRSFYTLTLHTCQPDPDSIGSRTPTTRARTTARCGTRTGMVTGDVSGKKARAFTHHDLPSKTAGDAYITSILLYYRNVGVGRSGSAWVSSNLAQLPPTGSFGGAVYQDQFTIVAKQQLAGEGLR